MNLKNILQQSKQFYPEYLKAHHNKMNRLLHFLGATLFFVIIGIFFFTWHFWMIPLAIFIGYLLPGLGHHYFQHNHSFRTSKPIICVICATHLYFDTLFFRIKRKMKSIN